MTVVGLADGGSADTGERARGGDQNRRFVDVLETTAPLTPDGLALVADAVVPAYAEFAPRCLRVWVADPAGLASALSADARFGPGCAVDQYVVAGAVRELRARPRLAAYPRVSLVPGDAPALADRVAEIYAALVEVEPDVLEWAEPEDAEDLAECAADGLLFEVLTDDVPAGVVAASRRDAYGQTGFVMREICLWPQFRGKGLGPAVLQHLVDVLPDGPGDALWGTIDAENQASLHNAQAAGRAVVGGYVWVTPLGLPGMPA